MATREFEVPSTIATTRALRIFVVDSDEELPEAGSIYESDIYIVIESHRLLIGNDDGGELDPATLSYTAAEPTGHWLVAPTTVEEALNELASRVTALENP